MTKLLVLESSIFPAGVSASRAVTAKFVARWVAKHPGTRIVRRDLAANPVPHAALPLLSGAGKRPEDRTAEERAAVSVLDELTGELFDADVIVIGAPMYNFSIPSTLKSWIDAIAIAGRTFRYLPDGRPEGLVLGKKVYVIASRGGLYSEGPLAALNFQDTYLRAVLGLLGLTDLHVIAAERQKMGPEQQAIGSEIAARQIDELAG
ncbi:MAG: FMN-dependent NADH-azoreductase [Beijerinckiaceae bacterium]|nr:FMN-dependent NADH-azoreductase [Beijerinckiaceae bacterium]